MLLAGKSTAIITPPVGAPTLGTIQRSTGVHDDLYARCLVLSDGQNRVAVLALDLIGLPFSLADEIRGAIAEETDIRFVLINCSHNHSAPFTIPWSIVGSRWLVGRASLLWRTKLVSRIVSMVKEAARSSFPARLYCGRAPVQIGFNRRLPSDQGIVMKPNPAGAVVPWVDVLRVDNQAGAPEIVLFSHAAHPVIIHGSSRLISAEFPGFAVRKLQSLLGDSVQPMFLQACGGNINGNPLRGGIDEAEKAGAALAHAAFNALQASEPIESRQLTAISAYTKLPLQILPPIKQLEDVLSAAESRLVSTFGRSNFSDEELWDMQDVAAPAKSQSESSDLDDVQPMENKAWWMMDTILCLRDLLRKVEQRDETQLRFDAHLLRIGSDWSLIAASHELFAEYQLMLDSEAPTHRSMVLAYTNGCESYIPMDADLPLGGYEAATFPEDGAALRYKHRRALAPGCQQRVLDQLHGLWFEQVN